MKKSLELKLITSGLNQVEFYKLISLFYNIKLIKFLAEIYKN